MSVRSLNKVLLIGNLTRDPEMRYTPQGTAVCTFGLATNREWVDGSGQKQEGAEFHNIVAWTKLAEICSQLLFKGRKAYVSGRLQTRSWQGQDGVERSKTEVVADNRQTKPTFPVPMNRVRFFVEEMKAPPLKWTNLRELSRILQVRLNQRPRKWLMISRFNY